jgi:hypothetical protein
MRGLGIVVLAALATACSDSAANPGSVLGTAPSSALNSAADNSCPHDAPAGFSVGGFGTRIDFVWSAVPNITDYEIEVDHYDVSNTYVTAARFITKNATRADWRGTVDAKYRARLRTRTACGTYGVWTAYRNFSIDGGTKPSDPSPINPTVCESESNVSEYPGEEEEQEQPQCGCNSMPLGLLPEEPQGPSCPSPEE